MMGSVGSGALPGGLGYLALMMGVTAILSQLLLSHCGGFCVVAFCEEDNASHPPSMCWVARSPACL